MKRKTRLFNLDLKAINRDVHKYSGGKLTLHNPGTNPGPFPHAGVLSRPVIPQEFRPASSGVHDVTPTSQRSQGAARTGTEIITGHPSTFHKKNETWEETQLRYQREYRAKRIAHVASKRGNIRALLGEDGS